MARKPTTTVQLRRLLSKFGIGDARNLNNEDTEATKQAAFDRLKAELTHAFAAPETSYITLTATEVIQRYKNNEVGNR